MNGPGTPLVASLRRLLQPTAAGAACDLCDAPLGETHVHIVDTHQRRLLCACESCGAARKAEPADAAHSDGKKAARYKPVSFRRGEPSPRPIDAAHWQALEVPVDLAFFFFNSDLRRVVACYPGPAGAFEALPPPEGWLALTKDHPWIEDIAPDVEALLVRGSAGEYLGYRVPIDACYELVGRIRAHWSGMDGGNRVRAEIDAFFDRLTADAATCGGAAEWR